MSQKAATASKKAVAARPKAAASKAAAHSVHFTTADPLAECLSQRRGDPASLRIGETVRSMDRLSQKPPGTTPEATIIGFYDQPSPIPEKPHLFSTAPLAGDPQDWHDTLAESKSLLLVNATRLLQLSTKCLAYAWHLFQETESTSKPDMNATSALRMLHFLFFSAMLLALGPRQVVASSTSAATVIGLNNHKFEIQMKPDQRLSVSEAIRMALGAPSPPNLKRVKLVRETPTGKKTILIELIDLGTPKGRKRDVFIRPTDVILAPSLRLPPVL